MKKRKENMTPDYRKSGYLKIGRSVLRAFFTGERELMEMANMSERPDFLVSSG